MFDLDSAPSCTHATTDRAAPRDTIAADDARVLVWARAGVDVRHAGGLPRARIDAAVARLTAHGHLARRTVMAQDQLGRRRQHVRFSATVSA